MPTPAGTPPGRLSLPWRLSEVPVSARVLLERKQQVDLAHRCKAYLFLRHDSWVDGVRFDQALYRRCSRRAVTDGIADGNYGSFCRVHGRMFG